MEQVVFLTLGHTFKSSLQLFSPVEQTKCAFCENGQVSPIIVDGLKHIFQKASDFKVFTEGKIQWVYLGLKCMSYFHRVSGLSAIQTEVVLMSFSIKLQSKFSSSC